MTTIPVTRPLLERHERVAEPPDSDVISGLARGDTRAFDRVYAQLRAPLYAFLVRLSGQTALAEDLMQETWLRLARTAPDLPEATRLRPWLFTVARNLYWSHRRGALIAFDRLRQLGSLQETVAPSPFELAAASATERVLEQALARLPPEQREVLLLCSVCGFEPAEAADMLGLSPEATRQRLARARAQLRQSLEPHQKVRR